MARHALKDYLPKPPGNKTIILTVRVSPILYQQLRDMKARTGYMYSHFMRAGLLKFIDDDKLDQKRQLRGMREVKSEVLMRKPKQFKLPIVDLDPNNAKSSWKV